MVHIQLLHLSAHPRGILGDDELNFLITPWSHCFITLYMHTCWSFIWNALPFLLCLLHSQISFKTIHKYHIHEGKGTPSALEQPCGRSERSIASDSSSAICTIYWVSLTINVQTGCHTSMLICASKSILNFSGKHSLTTVIWGPVRSPEAFARGSNLALQLGVWDSEFGSNSGLGPTGPLPSSATWDRLILSQSFFIIKCR